MSLSRRAFLKSSLIICAAPLVVRAESLMKVLTPPKALILPKGAGEVWGCVGVGGYIYSNEFSRVLRESLRPVSSYGNDDLVDALNTTLGAPPKSANIRRLAGYERFDPLYEPTPCPGDWEK